MGRRNRWDGMMLRGRIFSVLVVDCMGIFYLHLLLFSFLKLYMCESSVSLEKLTSMVLLNDIFPPRDDQFLDARFPTLVSRLTLSGFCESIWGNSPKRK
jgi:hypothetical protein